MTANVGPSFRSPPVVETVLSIQFDELQGFQTVHFGMFHATVKDRYPVAKDQPRLERVAESFPLVPRVPTLRLSAADRGPGRVWFRDAADGSTMIQLQPDRFAFNWCKSAGQTYPRYTSNQPKLVDEFTRFRAFAAEHELGDVKPNLCEVTYVNHIPPSENETPAECFAAVFAGLNWESSDGWLPQPPDIASLNRVYTIGEQKGRLYAEAGIANDKTMGDFVGLKITARVIHNDEDDVWDNLDLAHRWVVKSFVSLTDKHVRRERWEQEQ